MQLTLGIETGKLEIIKSFILVCVHLQPPLPLPHFIPPPSLFDAFRTAYLWQTNLIIHCYWFKTKMTWIISYYYILFIISITRQFPWLISQQFPSDISLTLSPDLTIMITTKSIWNITPHVTVGNQRRIVLG